MSIRFKVILPYLFLTLVLAVTGVYVLTNLVSNSLRERLINQLLEAGRVVSDGIARQELNHIEVAGLVAYTRDFAIKVASDDYDGLADIALPLIGSSGAEKLILIDTQGREIFHLLKTSAGFKQVAESGAASLPSVQSLLTEKDPDSEPRRGLAYAFDGEYYYFTAIPLSLDRGNNNKEMVGVIVVGTSLKTLLPNLKSSALADLIFYEEGGQVIATTMVEVQGTHEEFYQSLATSPELYREALTATNNVPGADFAVAGRWYSLARGPLRISDDRLGVFAVVLPLNFVLQSATNSRTIYTLLFAVTMVGVVFIGYYIARLIIKPLYALMHTSQAIADGDLTQRSGVSSTDEIGVLATTFDKMTESLQERTTELEKTNRILEQMDRTKVNFISVSAHELRTPLTLINGYSQILEQRAGNDPELAPLAKGILEGSSRMTEIVNSMLDVSRIDNQTLQVVPESMEIKHLITNVRETFEQALEQRHLTLTIEDLDDLPPIYADPDLLFKVFYHLVMNAIKYTPDGRWIVISGRSVEETPEMPEIEIVVGDSGIGVALEHQELIFEKFFQIGEVHYHSSGKTKFRGGGPGLGLAIARGIVEAHKGRIWMESPGYDEVNNPGSKFFVRLPVNGVEK